jgi:hypothetical protein
MSSAHLPGGDKEDVLSQGIDDFLLLCSVQHSALAARAAAAATATAAAAAAAEAAAAAAAQYMIFTLASRHLPPNTSKVLC